MTILKRLIFCTSLLVLPIAAPIVQAAEPLEQEVQQKLNTIMQNEDNVRLAKVRIEVAPKEMPTGRVIDFTDLDTNKDGVFERDEVGEKLFSVFDRDSNRLIDNIEMKKMSLKVKTPMVKKTIETVDYYSDAKNQRKEVTEEEFMQTSNLSKFAKSDGGLSPIDFLEMPFNQVDVDRNGVIKLYEWKRAYAQSVRPLHLEPFNYN